MNEKYTYRINIYDVFDGLKKRWKLIFAIIILTTLISVVLSFFVITPQYEVSTQLFIGKVDEVDKNYDNSDIQMYKQLLQTYAQIVKTRDLIERAISSKDELKYLNVESIINRLTVVSVTDTQILQIKYKDSNPEVAAEILESISNEFIKVSKELVSNGNIIVIEGVEVPKQPVSPNKKANVMLGFLCGIFLSIGLVFMLDYLDNTYKTKEKLENKLGIPVIGIITDSES